MNRYKLLYLKSQTTSWVFSEPSWQLSRLWYSVSFTPHLMQRYWTRPMKMDMKNHFLIFFAHISQNERKINKQYIIGCKNTFAHIRNISGKWQCHIDNLNYVVKFLNSCVLKFHHSSLELNLQSLLMNYANRKFLRHLSN